MNALNINAIRQLLDWSAAAEMGVQVSGGKGAQLGRLARYGLPVGDGCVIPADICHAICGEDFFHAALQVCALPESLLSLELEKLRLRLMAQTMSSALTQALNTLLESKSWQQQALAVRSSAPAEDSAKASFAGIHHSALNVLGRAALDQAILAVLASLWTPQAVAYRKRIGMPHSEAAMAVVIMPMVEAKASGVIFTCDPRSGRDDSMVISAVRGLGEALVSGLVSGEDIVLGCNWLGAPETILERRAANAKIALEPSNSGGVQQRMLSTEEQSSPILNDAQALTLAALAQDAANALDYTKPWYDIEWIWDGARFHLVQARPVTVRPWYTYPGLQGQAKIWSNANTRDVLPLVMDALSWQGMKSSANTLLETMYQLAGCPILPGIQRMELKQGRAYFNMAIVQWEVYDGLGVAPAMINRTIGGHQPEITVSPLSLRQKFAHGARLLRFFCKEPAMRRRGLAESKKVFAQMHEERKLDLSTQSEAAWIAACSDPATNICAVYTGLSFMQTGTGSLTELLKLLDKLFPGEGNALAAGLMAGGAPSVSAQQGHDLLALASLAHTEPAVLDWLRNGHPGEWPESQPNVQPKAQFRAAFSAFIERYGHRGVYESYLRMPTLRETPSDVLASIAGLLDVDQQQIQARQLQALASAWTRIRQHTNWWQRAYVKIILKICKRDCNQRELARSSFMVLSEMQRLKVLEVARRLVARGILNHSDEIFDLTFYETADVLRGVLTRDAVQARIADRQAMAKIWQAEPAGDVVIEGENCAPMRETPVHIADEKNTWRGVAVGSGYVQGKVCIVHHPSEQARLQPGDILVAPSTDPSWVPLFLKAGGLIMETGGYISHGAIVAREFGIPAVVNLPGIMAQLHDGEIVAVDGIRGLVIRLESNKECELK